MIRKFQKTDTAQVMQIWLNGNEEAHPFVPKEYWEANFELVQDQLLQAEVFVYHIHGEICGFIGIAGDYIAGIFVDKKHRSTGIGKQLLDYVKSKYDSLSLHVYRKNNRAAAFYFREGFSARSEEMDEATGEAEYTMVWKADGRTGKESYPAKVYCMYRCTDDIQKSITIYKEQLSYGYIRTAYVTLTKYVAELKSKFATQYKTGNISFGYLDYTYFPFSNSYLKNQKLRFGVVLNHEKMRFELWLMGQNADVQKKYWEILKHSVWNGNREEMPKYSILEVVLENQIDFSDKDHMTQNIFGRSVSLSSEIQEYLASIRA